MVTLSRFELWFLFHLSGEGIVLGFKDPTIGMLTEEISEKIVATKRNLLKHEIISDNDHGEIKIQPEIKEILKSILTSQHSVIVHQRIGNTNITTRTIFFNFQSIVVLENIIGDNYRLTKFKNITDVKSLIMEYINDIVYMNKYHCDFNIQVDDLEQIRIILSTPNHFSDALNMPNTLKKKDLNLFRDTIQSQIYAASIIVYNNLQKHETKIPKGFSIIACDKYLWLLEIVDFKEKIARIYNVTKDQLANRIDLILPSQV